VNPAEVIKHEIQRQHVLMIVNFLGESVGEPSESPHVHPHGKILPLNVAGGYVVPVRVANEGSCHRSDALRWTVSRLCAFRFVAIQLDQHRVVNLRSESHFHSGQVNAVSVGGQLNAIGEARSQVVHKVLRVPGIASANAPTRNDFGIRAKSRPRPYVAVSKLAAQVGGDVLFLGVAERPNFVALDSLAGQIAHRFVLIFRAYRSDTNQQFGDGIFRNASHSHSGANGITFDKSRDYCDLAVNWEVVHA
jgi:hypothetical protein